jgi:hypothetical protein
MNWKNGRPKGTVKAVWQKTEWQLKKKKKKKLADFNEVATSNLHILLLPTLMWGLGKKLNKAKI